MRDQRNTVKLNLLDFVFFASEDVVPSFTEIWTLRFKKKHDEEEIKKAFRHMLSLYPRLRSIIVPTLFSYRMEILDDNSRRVDVLFNNAFKVKRDLSYNSEAYLDYRRSLLNAPFSLMQDLPLRIYLFPDNPESVVILSVHHMIFDGTGGLHMMNALLSHMNGQAPAPMPLENPGLIPGLLEKPFFRIPRQLLRSWKLMKEDIKKVRGDKIVRPSSRQENFYGPVNMHQHFISHPIKEIVLKTKELNCSVTVLFLAALANSFFRHTENAAGNVVSIVLSIDARPYFNKPPSIVGNFSLVTMINVYRDYIHQPRKMVEDIHAQLKRETQNFRERHVLQVLTSKLCTMAGKKNYARFANNAKKRGAFPITCAVSNLGNLDQLNSHGTNAGLYELIPTAPHPRGLFITMSGIDGHLNTVFTYPETDFTLDEIKKIVENFEKEMDAFLKP